MDDQEGGGRKEDTARRKSARFEFESNLGHEVSEVTRIDTASRYRVAGTIARPLILRLRIPLAASSSSKRGLIAGRVEGKSARLNAGSFPPFPSTVDFIVHLTRRQSETRAEGRETRLLERFYVGLRGTS